MILFAAVVIPCWVATLVLTAVAAYGLGGRDEIRRHLHEIERMKRRQP